jgi:hypothetical protein
MFKILDYKIPTHPYISEPLTDESVFDRLVAPEFFDRFGYELTYIESLYHVHNNVPGHVLVPGSPTDAAACIQDWMIQTEQHPHIFLDHCHLNTRYAYEGAALEQLKRLSMRYPRLVKILNIKPKYMVDFCLDYIVDDKVVELIHIEHDFHDYNQYISHIDFCETFIQSQDWRRAYLDLKPFFDNGYDYDEYAQAQYKAKYYGFDTLDYLHEPKMLSYKKVY